MFQTFKDKVQQAQNAVEGRIQQAVAAQQQQFQQSDASRHGSSQRSGDGPAVAEDASSGGQMLSLDEQEKLRVKLSKYEASLLGIVFFFSASINEVVKIS